MINLLTAIYSKLSGSTLFNDVGGRVFTDQAPEGTEFPYIVLSIISNVPDNTFTEDYEDTLIQFSIFSISESLTEISNIYADMKTLFDECSMTITSNTLIYMKRENLVTTIEDFVENGVTVGCRHWSVDYSIYMEAS